MLKIYPEMEQIMNNTTIQNSFFIWIVSPGSRAGMLCLWHSSVENSPKGKTAYCGDFSVATAWRRSLKLLSSHNTQNIRMESSMRVRMSIHTANSRIRSATGLLLLIFAVGARSCSWPGSLHVLSTQSYRYASVFILNCSEKVLNCEDLYSR